MTVKLSPLFNDAQLDASGNPYSGALLFTYGAGGSTKQTTYQDQGQLAQHTNPIVLNSRGEPPAPIWLTEGSEYKFVLTIPTDTDPPVSAIRTVDDVSGVNDGTGLLDEWIASGYTPTFVSATSFTVSGDRTTVLHVGRRLKTANTGGTIYSTITASSHAAGTTTITVANDSGSIDSGISSVSYSVTSANNPSINADMVHRKGTAVASAATCNIWGIVGDYVHVTGTTTITSLGTAPYAGAERTVIFDGALTLTHNATTLVLPGGANITTAANDRMVVRADTTANMIVLSYFTAATGAYVTAASDTATGVIEIATQAEQETGTDTTRAVSPGRQHFHPSAAKAWGVITPATTVSASYPASGVSVVKNGTGDFTVTHGVTFSSANYASVSQSLNAVSLVPYSSAKTTTTIRLIFRDDAGVLTDPTSFSYVLYGDL